MLFIFETCNALSQVTNVFAVKLYYLCRTGKPNQQLSYCLDENQPTHISILPIFAFIPIEMTENMPVMFL